MPKDLIESIEAAAEHVRSLGLTVELELHPPPSPSLIRRMRSACPLEMDAVVEVYRAIGDGFEIRWTGDEDHGPFGMACFLSLEAMVDRHVKRKAHGIEWDADHDFGFSDDPDRARETAQRMRQWLRFHEGGNGDAFCVEVADKKANVVFDQHDWFDGGTGGNGIVIASSLPEFVHLWSRVCFQRPRGLWWPNVIGKQGIDWSHAEFDQRLRIAR